MSEEKKKLNVIRTSQPDYWLLVAVLFLVGIGTVTVFSSSTVSSYLQPGGNSYSMLKKQIVYAVAGIFTMIAASLVSYKFIQRLSVPAFLFSVALLGLVPIIGKSVNYAKRWIFIGGFSFQPSELVKFGVILFLAFMFSGEFAKDYINKWWYAFVYLLPLGAIVFLLYKQPHMSCIVIIGAICFIMMVVARIKPAVFLSCGALAVAGAVLAFLTVPHFKTRILSFIGGGAAEADSAASYQINQSLIAIGSGGFKGRGLGQSIQKYQYLPEPYNDFIFSIWAEEMGFIGVAIVLILFGILIVRGYMIAFNAPDRYSSLVATGITSHIAIQTVLNIAVATKIIPVTGVALPFFSYGGTSLVIIMAEMGVLLGISKKSVYRKF